MSLVDHRKHSVTEQYDSAQPLQMPGMGVLDHTVEQLPFPDNSPLPVVTMSSIQPLQPQQQFSSRTTQALIDTSTSLAVARQQTDTNGIPHTTRQLPEVSTGTLVPLAKSNTTALRQPVIIRGSGYHGNRKDKQPEKTPVRRRIMIQLAVTALLIFIVLGTLVAVTPADSQGHGTPGIFSPILNVINTKGNNTALLPQQAATATAVTQDGYDPGPNTGQYAGVQAPPAGGSGSLNRFFYGQCTYWANMRYHELTGVWVPWLGNANQWVAGAYQYGWVVSGEPHVPSIIVLMGGVQGASPYYGHVAIVEKINADGTVYTSNWNWAGNWARTTYVNFTPGKGVYFVWAPGH